MITMRRQHRQSGSIPILGEGKGRSTSIARAVTTAPMLLAILVVGMLLPGGTVRASAPDQDPVTGASLVDTSVIASVDAIRPGVPFEIAIRYRMKPDWHIYWRNAGGSGMPPGIALEVPEGFEVGEIRWPTPRVFPGAEPSYGYAGEAVLLVPVTPPKEPALSPAEITIELDWLVCKKACLFGARTHELRLPFSAEAGEVSSELKASFAAWRKLMPRPMTDVPGVSARLREERLLVSGPATIADTVWFYPDDTPGVRPRTPGPVPGRVVGGRFIATLLRSAGKRPGGPLEAAGLVVLARGSLASSDLFQSVCRSPPAKRLRRRQNPRHPLPVPGSQS